jgi:hypothetical protein
MEKEYVIPRPGVLVEKAICTHFKADAWSVSVLYRDRSGNKFLSVLVLETGKQYTHEIR